MLTERFIANVVAKVGDTDREGNYMKKAVLSFFVALGLGFVTLAQAQDAAELAKAKNCLSCHAIDKKLVGPSYKSIAQAIAAGKDPKGKAIDVARVANSILKGSMGQWGPIPMPPNTAVSAEEAKILAEWIASLK
jgi:cytochrome c